MKAAKDVPNAYLILSQKRKMINNLLQFYLKKFKEIISYQIIPINSMKRREEKRREEKRREEKRREEKRREEKKLIILGKGAAK